MKRLLLTSLAVVALLFFGGALPALAYAQDAPRGADGLLTIPAAAPLTDLANVLNPSQQAALLAQLAQVEKLHGSQIAILIVPSTQPEPVADFAQRVGDAWKIGRPNVGDGVLLVVAIKDRRVWISVARALEGAIPDAIANRISRELIAPRFREGDFATGLSVGVEALAKQIAGEGLPAPKNGRATAASGSGFEPLLPFIIFGAFAALWLRRALGVPGSLLASGGTAATAGWVLSSALLGGVVGIAVLLLSLVFGARSQGLSSALGRRGGGPIFLPGGFGGGGWSGGGSSGGGWSSGGGGDFSGGGGGSDW